jgi:hypothetical protein
MIGIGGATLRFAWVSGFFAAAAEARRGQVELRQFPVARGMSSGASVVPWIRQ